MPEPFRVLILGGTTEAAELARALAADARFAATVSFAGRTSAPAALPVPSRSGGFGGAAGLAFFLHAERVAALVDATHPFAARISASAAEAARISGLALLAIRRPAWTAGAGDRWTRASTMAAAAETLGPLPRRVFLTVGRQDLAPFRAAPWHRYLIRSVEPPDASLLPPDAETIAARGPFVEAAERALLSSHGIEVVVTKDSGGSATRAKLDAARALGIAVVMVDRPALPELPSVPDAGGALAWLRDHAARSAARGV